MASAASDGSVAESAANLTALSDMQEELKGRLHAAGLEGAGLGVRGDGGASGVERGELTEGHKLAIKNYEEATGKKLTVDELIASKEGIGYWATQGLDMGARGAIRQQFKRALTWDQAAAQIYNGLEDSQKKSFVANWTVERNFEYTKVRKVFENTHRKTSGYQGNFITIWALANKLGGWQIKECREGAMRYAMMCCKLAPDAMVSTTSWTGLKMFNYIEKLSTTTCEETWKYTVENMYEENHWKQASDLNMAKIAYSVVNKVKPATVTKELLEKTEIGIAGWAAVSPSMFGTVYSRAPVPAGLMKNVFVKD